jgi:hypothetical protein
VAVSVFQLPFSGDFQSFRTGTDPY